MKGRKISIPKFHPMKLTFLFIVLILGIWLATTAFGRMFEGMEQPKTTGTNPMEEVMAKAQEAVNAAGGTTKPHHKKPSVGK